MMRQMLHNMLQATPDLTVIATASSQKEGLAACARHKPDLLVLDLALPDGSGVDVARHLVKLKTNIKLRTAGLGLYIVRTATENHRGETSFGRSPPGGAEARPRFPRTEKNLVTAEHSRQPKAKGEDSQKRFAAPGFTVPGTTRAPARCAVRPARRFRCALFQGVIGESRDAKARR